MIKYDKMVRDRIPEIIEQAGKEYKSHTVDRATALDYLIRKFDEELNEFKEAYSKEELADILELIYALAFHLDYDVDEIESIRQKKAIERGGFEKRIILDHVIE